VFRALLVVAAAVLLAACVSTRLVYSNGFSFANYDYVVVAKPDGDLSGSHSPMGTTALYGMDVEFANMISRYNMKVIGDRELAQFSDAQKSRALYARMALAVHDRNIVMSVSFDDAVTDRTMASITADGRGDIFDGDDRGKVFEKLSKHLIKAIESEKGLTVTDVKGS
jgi:hypothetical protein